MAYLRDLEQACQAPYCLKKASVELLTFRNDRFGVYCKQHGEIALRDRTQAEDDYWRGGGQ